MNKYDIFIAGDYCLYDEYHNTRLVFSPELSQLVNNSDVSCLNLECPITSSAICIPKTGPALKANVSAIKTLKASGFNICSLANNHIMDFGAIGLRETMALLDDYGIAWFGVQESGQSGAHVHKVRDKKIAFVSFTENEYSTISIDGVCAVAMDYSSQYRTICDLRESVDFIIVLYHGGVEMYPYPTPNQQKYCRFLIDIGADLVICHHSHVISSSEVNNGNIIYYGLGNFYFPEDGAPAEWYEGLGIGINVSGAISTQVIPIKYDALNHCLCIEPSVGSPILSRFYKLTEDIAKEGYVENAWQEFCDRQIYDTLKSIIPLTKLERAYIKLFHRKDLIKDKVSLSTLNALRCESHREKLTTVISSIHINRDLV